MSKSRTRTASPTPLVEELEPRLLLSAGIEAALLADAANADLVLNDQILPPAVATPATTASISASTNSVRHEIVFVDANAPDVAQLVAQLEASDLGDDALEREIVLLDAQRDGIEQIAETLVRYSDLDAVHVISHGNDGALTLGNARLDGQSLAAYRGIIGGWGDALDADADILLYGCDLAAGEDGRALIDALADLTGADIAASTDVTGHAALGGDWDLELHSGKIETAVVAGEQIQTSWRGALVTVSFQQGSGGYNGTQDTELRGSSPDTSYGAQAFTDVQGNVGSELQGLLRFDGLFGSGPGQIPLGSTITAASLTIEGFDDTTFDITFHRMLQAWSEASTFNSMVGGIQTDNVEAQTTADATLVAPAATTHTLTGLEATLQAWSNGAANHGWAVLSTGTNDFGFLSSETGTVSERPLLQVTYVAPTTEISGTVLEDVNGDGILADAVNVAGVDVDLYVDDGDGVIDAGDSLVGSTTTNASGDYTFSGVGNATYWVVVDSTTIAPDAGYNGGFASGDVWAEQTYGSVGAVSFDGSYSYLGAAGALYGGLQAEVADDASALTSAEHVTRVVMSGADVTGVDSAFSFNVITRTGDGDVGPGNRTLQGALRQFVGNSNAIAGTQSSVFVIDTSDSNYNGSGNGEYTINLTAGWDPFLDDTVIMDATTQSGYSGDPIIELDASGAGFLTAGFALRANDSVLRGFIVHGSPDEGLEVDGSTGFGDNNIVQNNWIGLNASGAMIGNGDNGFLFAVDAVGNLFGGTGPNDGNIVVGSTSAGVMIRNTGTDNNVVEGNYIGVGPDGVTAMPNVRGLEIALGATNNQIGGATAAARNVISGNNDHGVVIWDAATQLNTFAGNYIGLDASGTLPVGNQFDGIFVGGGASNNTFGGSAPGEGNVISGNLDDGIEMGNSNTTGNSILGNRIGTNAAGTAPIANGRHGIVIYNGANNTQIGGSGASEGNLISGNGEDGIVIDGAFAGTTINNTVHGNRIGTDAAGTAPIANANHGINIFGGANSTQIGGSGAGEGNLISGNDAYGIAVTGTGTSSNVIQGNLIGTDISGTVGLGNGLFGMWIFSGADNNTVGGSAAGEGNVIGANGGFGVAITSADGTTVVGNFIGTDTGGTIDLGNSLSGVAVQGDSASTDVGGVNPGDGNVIANNDGAGVLIGPSAGLGNSILRNSIYGNTELGIDIVESGNIKGVTANDTLDADGGANNQQNFPLLISSNTDESGNVYVAGTMNAAASTTYRVEFFGTPTADASGYGQGAIYLGFANITTDAGGKARFSTILGSTLPAGYVLSTTATAPDGSTSEFSAVVDANRMGVLVVDTTLDSVDGNVTSIDALLSDRGADERISLREAILATNVTANAGVPDEIHFNLQLDDPNHFYYQDDGSGGSLSLVANTTLADADIGDFDPDYPAAPATWFRFQPTSALPSIDQALIIDGFSQDGASANTLAIGSDAVMKIVIDGKLSGNVDAFVINAPGSGIHGLVITDDFMTAIVVNAANVDISGNYIGTDVTGSMAGAQLDFGVVLQAGAVNTTVGGSTPAARNVISGMTKEAITVTGATTYSNTIEGNYIGTNAQGDGAIANTSDGVLLIDGTYDNEIRGNVISGNNRALEVDGTAPAPINNTIAGNLIGTDAAGTFAIANSVGILLRRGASNTTIGGTSAADRNIISGNSGFGIQIRDVDTVNNTVIGNYIGTDITGSAALGNSDAGILISNSSSGNRIGGTAAGEGNVISANQEGIDIDDADGNVVEGNLIGTDSTGTVDLGNLAAGVVIQSNASGNTIGGTSAGAGNVIAHNDGAGVFVKNNAGTGNAILGNAIYDSTGLGIWHEPGGLIPPDLATAGTDGVGTVLVNGSIDAAASTTYRIEFFANAVGDPLGAGEGEVYLGYVDVTTDGTGHGDFNAVLSAVVAPGAIISATSTDPANNTSEFAVNVVATSDPPVIDLDADDSAGQGSGNFATTFVEDGGPVAIADADATLIDPDSTISSMTVTITNLLDGALESLAANTGATGITASYDSGTGVLTLSGVNSVANYQAVLRTITYDNSSDAPDPTSRVLQFSAYDGTFTSNVATTTLSITLINDAPVLSPVSPSLPSISEDDLSNGGVQVSTLLGATVADPDAGAVEGIAIVSLFSSNGTWQYSLDGGGSWLNVGAVSVNNALLLRATDYVRFVPDGENADSASFGYRAWDQTSGTAGGVGDTTLNGGQTAFSSTFDAASITVTAVNDAPVLTPAAPSLPTITEDDVANGGQQVSVLLGGSVSDVDTGAVEGIAITGLTSGNGTWQYSLDGGTSWLNVGAAANNSALLLRSTDFIRFVPDGQNADSASVTFRAWDRSSGSAGALADTSTNGNQSAFSTAVDTASITVTAVNDAPVVAPAAPSLPTITEDDVANGGQQISVLLGASVSDVDTGAVEGIAITSLSSGNGSWQYSLDGGTSWLNVGAVANNSALLLRSTDFLRFVPDAQNADSASVTYRAWDRTSGSAGTLADTSTNGNQSPFSAATDTASITVTAVNDAPVLTPAAPALPTVTEDDLANGGQQISALIGVSVADVDAGAIEGIAITGLSSGNGTWQYSLDGGTSWLDVGAVANNSALLLRATDFIRFVPDGDNADSASFTYRAWDQASGSAGALADTSANGNQSPFSTATDTASITVTAVNDAPVLTPAAPALPTITEDEVANGGQQISVLLGASVSDVDSGAVEGIAITGLTSGNGTWQYSIDGGTSWLNVGAVANNSALLLRSTDFLRFVPDAENADSASVTYRAWDRTSGSAGTLADTSTNGNQSPFSAATDTASITVTAVNDAPLLTPSTPALPTITEDDVTNGGQQVSALLGASVSDVDTGAVEGIAITSLSSGNGTWQYSLDGGTSWLNVGAVANNSALLLRSTDFIRFVPDAENADSASITYRAWDQTSGSAGALADTSTNGNQSSFSATTDTASITVTAVNDAPVVTGLSGDSTIYTAGDGAIVVEQGGDVLVSDVDSANFNAGDLTVSFLAGSDPVEDVLSIRDQGTGAGQIGFDGTSVTYGGVLIGTASGGSGGVDLSIALNANATDAAVAALIENITYENSDSVDPSTGARAVRFELRDGGGGVSASYDTTVNLPGINTGTILDRFGVDAYSNNDGSENWASNWIEVDSSGGGATGGRIEVRSGVLDFQVASAGNNIYREANLAIATSATLSFNYDNSLGASATLHVEVSGDGGVTYTTVAIFDASTNTGAGNQSIDITAFADANTRVRFYVVSGETGAGNNSFWADNVQIEYTYNTDPMVTLPGSAVNYTENDGAVVIDSLATVADAESTDFSGGVLTVDFTAGGTANDRLSVRDQGTGTGEVGVSGTDVTYEGVIIGTFSGGTDGSTPLTITFNASADQAAVQAIARSITYANVSDDPNTTARTVRFVLTDGDGGTSVAATETITLTALNDAPVLTPASPSLPTITEDDVANGGQQVSVLLGASVSDVDSGAVEGIAIIGLSSGNGTWQYSLDGGTSWLNVGAVANNSALLLRATDFIRFVPDGENADAASFTYRAWDRTSGSAGALADTSTNGNQSPFSAATDTASITVTAVNDAPVLAPAAPSFTTITEDDFSNGGEQVSILLGASVSDVDTGAVEGIAITSLSSGNGTWQYSLDGGSTWVNVGAVANNSALLLRATDFLRFVPDGENADAASITYRAWDQTSGSAGALADTSTNGNQSPFSAASDTASISVAAINDAPVLTPAAPSLPTITEDDVANGGQQISVLLGGSVSDVDTGALEGIAITGLASSNGTWQYSLDGGTAWLNVGAVANNSALLLRATDFLRFVPDGENADAASFTYRAWDRSSSSAGALADTTTNGNQAPFSTLTDTASITITAVNDAPVLTPVAPSLPTITEDEVANSGQQISVLLGGSVSDVDTGAIEGIAITGLSSGSGTWQYSLDGGASWLNVGAVANNSALLLRATDYIRFVPDGENADAAGITYRAWDQSAGAAGALADTSINGNLSAFSSTVDTASITVTAVNDAPVLTPAAPSLPTITEDNLASVGQQVSALLGGSVSDVDAGAIEGIAITTVSSGNGTWQYSLDGGASWLNVGAVANNSALLLRATDFIRFVPDGENADTASISYRAWDQSTGAAGALADTSVNGNQSPFSATTDTASITITAVNDAPVLTPVAPALPTVTEDDVANGGQQISVLLGGSVSDVDTGAIEGIAITGLAAGNGTWQYSLDGGTSWLNVGAVANNSALLLRATDFIRFVPDGENADSASITYRAWDLTSGSAGALADTSTNGNQSPFSATTDTASITVTAVNDAPLLTPAAPSLPGITEDELSNGGEQIAALLGASVSDVDIGAVEGIAITGLASSNGTWQYSLDGGASWLDVGAVANNSALLLRSTDFIRFVPDGDNADTASITYRAWDLTSGSAGALADTSTNGNQSPFSTATDSASITVTAVNDAPLLTPAAPSLPGITEDELSNGGEQIAALLGASVSDVDTGSVEGVAITSLSSGNGTWQYSLDGGTSWLNVGAVANNSALLLRSTDFIRFVPDGDNADTASITYRAWDLTSGSAGALADASTNGNQSAFSATTDTASITVAAINDAPLLTPSTPSLPTITEDDVANAGQQVGVLLGASVGDVDTGSVEGVAITGLSSGNGTWQYSLDGGASWLNVGTVANNSALLLRATDFIRFVPDGQNADTASFTYRAWDQSGGVAGTLADTTSNGGQTAYSTATDTASISVTAANDAPVLTPASPSLPTITEDDVTNGGQQVAALLGGSVSDLDSGSADGIAITTQSAGNGTWQYSLDGGASWLDVGAVSNNSALLLRSTDFIRFVPDGENADSASLTYRAWDQTSGAAGTTVDTAVNGNQTAYSTATDTASIGVTAVNDAPVLDPAAVLSLGPVVEDDTNPPGDTVTTILASALGDPLTDVDAGAVEGIAVTAVDNSNGTWQYSIDAGASWLDFGAVSTNNAVLLDNAAAVRFVPDAGYIGNGGSVTFHGWDRSAGLSGQTGVDVSITGGSSAFSTLAASFTITVTPVNDTPTTSGIAPVAVDEDAAPTVIDLHAAFDDLEDADVALTFTVTGNTNPALFGSLVVDAAGGTLTLAYLPNANGSALVTVRATDTSGAFVETDVTVNVSAVNDAPTTSGIANIAGSEDGAPLSIDLLTLFDDIEDGAGALTFNLTGNSNPALVTTAVNNADGTATFTPIADANGTTTLTIRATDTAGAIVEATFNLTLAAVNDAPTALGLPAVTVNEDAPGLTLDLSAAFADIDDLPAALSYTLVGTSGDPVLGATVDAAAGTLSLQFLEDHNGDATVTVRAVDASGAFADVDVQVTVTPVDDAPRAIVPAGQSTNQNSVVLFSSGQGNAIRISDPDGGQVTVTLSTSDGGLFLANTAGLVFANGSGGNGATLTFTGSVDAVNAALDGLQFQPSQNFAGITTITVSTQTAGAAGSPSVARFGVIVLDAAGADEILAKAPQDTLQTTKPAAESEAQTDDDALSEPAFNAPPPPQPDLAVTSVGGLPAFQGATVLHVLNTLVESVERDDTAQGGTGETDLASITRRLLALGAGNSSSALLVNDAVFDALDMLKKSFDQSGETALAESEMVVAVATGVTLSLSAGFVTWIMRAGALLTSLLSTTPVWRGFDPLPILGTARDDEDDFYLDVPNRNSKAEKLFDDVGGDRP